MNDLIQISILYFSLLFYVFFFIGTVILFSIKRSISFLLIFVGSFFLLIDYPIKNSLTKFFELNSIFHSSLNYISDVGVLFLLIGFGYLVFKKNEDLES